jgi:hypothetical protein
MAATPSGQPGGAGSRRAGAAGCVVPEVDVVVDVVVAVVDGVLEGAAGPTLRTAGPTLAWVGALASFHA